MSTRRSQFNKNNIGDDNITEIVLPDNFNKSPLPNIASIQTQLKRESLKDRQANRRLRVIYASIAVCFAIASIIFWMRFVQFYYDPKKHSDVFFTTLTSACTINILAAFISIIKGLFPSSK